MNISTTVAAQGQAEAPHDLAHYHVVLKADGTTVPTAKARLKKQVEELMTSIEAMRQKINVEFVKHSLRTNTNVQQKYEWNEKKRENEPCGFHATYTLSFTIDDLDKISEVYDALTNLDKVAVANPSFSLKNRDKLNKKALKKAFENVQSRFEEECNVLGLASSDFEVGTWEVSYSDSQRSDRVAKGVRVFAAASGRPGAAPVGAVMGAEIESAAFGGAGEEDTLLEINPGNATVTVNLEVGYIRRMPIPVKASVVSQGHSTQANITV